MLIASGRQPSHDAALAGLTAAALLALVTAGAWYVAAIASATGAWYAEKAVAPVGLHAGAAAALP